MSGGGGATGGAEVRVRRLAVGVGPPPGPEAARTRARLDALAKPPGSLGRLEDLAVRLARVYGDPPPSLHDAVVFLLAGDHGVARRGVSAYPPRVTAEMCRNFVRGGAAICALAGAVGCRVVVADLGVDAELSPEAGILDRKVGRGTADLSRGPAMSRKDAARAVLAGAELVERLDPEVAVLGEMGIGNSTSAAALAAALTGAPAREVVGPGTGVDRERLARKRAAVEDAVGRLGAEGDPLELLARVGGYEIAGLAGVTLAAARSGRAVVTDGFIATAAAAVAVQMAPPARDYVVAGHRSPEPGHRRLLEALRLDPLLELELRLGEGTGATLALPLLRAAAAVLREMATFGEAGVSGPEGAPGEPGPEEGSHNQGAG